MSDSKLQALISALSAYGINVQSTPVPTPTPKPTPTPTPPVLVESQDGASVIPGIYMLIDATLTTWAITSSKVIVRGGITDTSTQRVNLLVYKNHTVYQRNDDMMWWGWIHGVWAQASDPTNGAAPQTGPATVVPWLDAMISGMAYKVLLPSWYVQGQQYPVVLYLHQLDMGTDVKDLLTQVNAWFDVVAFRTGHQVIVVMPLLDQSADPSGQTVNFGGVGSSITTGRDQALACLQQVINTYGVDRSRIYVTGNSMGGIGTWELVCLRPDLFAAAMPLAGANYARDVNTEARKLVNKPIWAIHGAQDTQVPLSWDRAMYAAIHGMNGQMKYSELANLGHDVWDTVYPDPQYLGWLLSQSMSTTDASSPPTASGTGTVGTTTPSPTGRGLPLSAGALSTRGNQIVDSAGVQQRIASIGWNEQFDNIAADVKTMRSLGFNCARVSWVDATLDSDLARIDQMVAACRANNMRLILDHHTNEAGTAADGYGAQQKNGKPWDSGAGTDGTNGAGITGAVTRQVWINNWVRIAQRYRGSGVVVGCDLHNEPLRYGLSTWGDGSAVDLRSAYIDCGNAILQADPSLLIICEGAQDYNLPAPWGDLSVVAKQPVTLQVANKVVYSVHNYPTYVSGYSPDSGPTYKAQMEQCFGYLMTQNIAPVWIGEMGANFDGTWAGEDIIDSKAWATDTLDYMESFAKQSGDQPMGGDWWAWGQLDGQQLVGIMQNGQPRATQQPYWSRLLFNR